MTTETKHTQLALMDDDELLAWAKDFRDAEVSTTIAKERTFTEYVGEFPANAIMRYMAHGFQRLHNDAVGGKDKFATTAAKLDYVASHIIDMKTGKVGRQAAGAGATPEIIRARTILRRALKASMDKADYKRDFTDAEPADQIKALDALLEKNPAFVEEARAELAKESKLAESITF